MKNLFRILITVSLLPIASLAQAQSESPIICNQCTSDADFTNLAQTLEPGEYIVTNLEELTARKFIVTPFGGFGSGKLVQESVLPAYVSDALQEYSELKSYLEDPLNQSMPLNNSTGQTQGLKDWIFNGCTNVPDFPFLEACNRHDTCFYEGNGFSLCNRRFYEDMLATAAQYGDAFGSQSLFKRLITKILLENYARIYFAGVEELGKDFYCQIDSGRPLCSTDGVEEPFLEDPASAGGVFVSTATSNYQTISSGSGGGSVGITCEVWEFPGGISGTYLLVLNCE